MVQYEHEYRGELAMTDRETGWVMEWGTLLGVPILYLATVAVVLLAGGSLAFALAAALVPAVVGGPFFGILGALARVEHRHHPRSA